MGKSSKEVVKSKKHSKHKSEDQKHSQTPSPTSATLGENKPSTFENDIISELITNNSSAVPAAPVPAAPAPSAAPAAPAATAQAPQSALKGDYNPTEKSYDVDLGNETLLRVKPFKGKIYIDIRKQWDGKPTRKGVSLSVETFKALQSWTDLDHAINQCNGKP